MCGIFGFSLKNKNVVDKKLLKQDISLLYKLSEVRGVEAAGFAMQSNQKISMYKKALPAYKMSLSSEYKHFFDKVYDNIKDEMHLNFIAHSRLVTNGVQSDNINNQPTNGDSLVCVHNGIVTNTQELIKQESTLNIKSSLDTELLIKLINKEYVVSRDLVSSVIKTYNRIEGNANLAILDDLNQILISTNNGSIYYIEEDGNLVFASEIYILNEYIKSSKLNLFKNNEIIHLESCSLLFIEQNNITKLDFSEIKTRNIECKNKNKKIVIDDYDSIIMESRNNLKRCSKCILPETMPFIEFDENDECNYCKTYQPKELLGKKALEKRVEDYIKTNGNADLVFAFSGGRDSCYSLHYLVKEMGIKPIAYSYDWGMITALGRRNQARMLGKLGVEHVIVSANLREKRKNIRKNVEAWLKKPDLGMIPLIIAGDKQMFYYAQLVQENYNAKAFMFSTNYLEKTDFKTGFAGVNTVDLKGLSMSLTKKNKFMMIKHYLKNFIYNPSYLNSSLIDTFDAFTKYYNKKVNERIEFYDYIQWDEDTVNNTLISEYNWETSSDTTTTWRIGDGTAAFYNYIYLTVAGFTENDTFRSNQIREGVLSRENALKLVEIENKPRWQTIKEYCDLIQVDFVKAIEVIDNIPKLYMKNKNEY